MWLILIREENGTVNAAALVANAADVVVQLLELGDKDARVPELLRERLHGVERPAAHARNVELLQAQNVRVDGPQLGDDFFEAVPALEVPRHDLDRRARRAIFAFIRCDERRRRRAGGSGPLTSVALVLVDETLRAVVELDDLQRPGQFQRR